MKKRCSWLNLENSLYVSYHDNEWWEEVHDDRKLFEMLTLEWAQAGLSWETILKRREWYKETFDDFDVQKIIKYDEKKIYELMNNTWIIRNKLKIRSVIKNAGVFIELQKEFWSFVKYILWFVDWNQIKNHFIDIS